VKQKTDDGRGFRQQPESFFLSFVKERSKKEIMFSMNEHNSVIMKKMWFEGLPSFLKGTSCRLKLFFWCIFCRFVQAFYSELRRKTINSAVH